MRKKIAILTTLSKQQIFQKTMIKKLVVALSFILLANLSKNSYANGYSYKTGCKYSTSLNTGCVGSIGYIHITPWQESEKKNKDLTCKLNIFVKSSKKNPDILEPMRNLPKVGSVVRPNSPLIFYQDLEQIKRQYEICDKAITEIDKRVNYKKVGFKSAEESKLCGISGCLARIDKYDANGEEDILGVGNRLEIISYENLKEGLFAKIKVIQ